MQLLSNVYLSQHFRCLFVTVPWWGTQAQMHDTSHKPKSWWIKLFLSALMKSENISMLITISSWVHFCESTQNKIIFPVRLLRFLPENTLKLKLHPAVTLYFLSNAFWSFPSSILNIKNKWVRVTDQLAHFSVIDTKLERSFLENKVYMSSFLGRGPVK